MNNYLRQFDGDLLSNLFDSFESERNLLATDIKENDNSYILEIEMPGIKKEDVKISFEDKYLLIEAAKNHQKDNNKYLHHERSFGKVQRRYYVGNIKPEGIKASMVDGVLTIDISKELDKKELKYISIQ